MRRAAVALLFVAVSVLAVFTVNAGASPTYFAPGTNCSVHWNADGSLRIKLVNRTSTGGYIHCLYKTWGGLAGKTRWNSSRWVGAYRYAYMTNGRWAVRNANWVNVTGSYKS